MHVIVSSSYFFLVGDFSYHHGAFVFNNVHYSVWVCFSVFLGQFDLFGEIGAISEISAVVMHVRVEFLILCFGLILWRIYWVHGHGNLNLLNPWPWASFWTLFRRVHGHGKIGFNFPWPWACFSWNFLRGWGVHGHGVLKFSNPW